MKMHPCLSPVVLAVTGHQTPDQSPRHHPCRTETLPEPFIQESQYMHIINLVLTNLTPLRINKNSKTRTAQEMVMRR
ncbi:hypothetical protein SESBI_30123 [Sesbania bispinosa]|nr:hypothetical protein SESBI_30123 [Sesbania bispinosa]